MEHLTTNRCDEEDGEDATKSINSMVTAIKSAAAIRRGMGMEGEGCIASFDFPISLCSFSVPIGAVQLMRTQQL